MIQRTILEWWRANSLRAIVFITGGTVLVVEIAATRILSPYYGNTIYAVSSIISVILLALSVGYAVGGKRADANPTFQEFYRIIYHAGISLLVLFILTVAILPVGGYFFSLKAGPLIWSVILFFPVGFLMGMLSPFAITLGAKMNPEKGLGTMSGNIFFWSTAGSIIGSLLAGFVLIPIMGLNALMASATATILLLGGAGLYVHSDRNSRRELAIGMFFLFVTLGTVYYMIATTVLDPRVRFSQDGLYGQLSVRDQMIDGRPTRTFSQDRGTSGGILLDSIDHAFDYTKYYALYKLGNPVLSNALVLGGGIYTIPKAINEERGEAIIDVVEIEPGLDDLAKKYFSLQDAPQIRTHLTDGRRFLHETKTLYDFIFSDVYYSLYSIPTHFTTKEFFITAKERMAPGGIFVANMIGSTEEAKDSLLFSEVRTMKEVFPVVMVLAVGSPDTTDVQNFILIGATDGTADELSGRMAQSNDPFLSSLPSRIVQIDDAKLLRYTLLTDDYAPVDHLVTRFINKPSFQKVAEASTLSPENVFSGERAMKDIVDIVALGSRQSGTEGNATLRNIIITRMKALGLTVTEDTWTHTSKDGSTLPLGNVLARLNPTAQKRIIVGTHHDSIARAYRDLENPNGYMPGANNSASGVALLFETARVIKNTIPNTLGVDFVFFDAEEGEFGLGAGDMDWKPLGSQHFVSTLAVHYPTTPPSHAVIFDMVCDSDLVLLKDTHGMSSAKNYQEKFWSIGGAMNPEVFNHREVQTVGDDHIPFIARGIPAFVVIDFSYEPWFNTTKDTPERCSAKSLALIGATLERYLQSEK